ncbi:hypothetical protein HYFRA_00005658 [Hymenoscyphus fraxineus]|uniref:Uncharacterized protein n=1 Tax=Hymenoscyphus fraxineus TaxID=746836 RepID=A0A9N9KQ56_9HELO|nr:hypothetical protein HYFRA_00005658 [Hymenoscyphus fraxineus]
MRIHLSLLPLLTLLTHTQAAIGDNVDILVGLFQRPNDETDHRTNILIQIQPTGKRIEIVDPLVKQLFTKSVAVFQVYPRCNEIRDERCDFFDGDTVLGKDLSVGEEVFPNGLYGSNGTITAISCTMGIIKK